MCLLRFACLWAYYKNKISKFLVLEATSGSIGNSTKYSVCHDRVFHNSYALKLSQKNILSSNNALQDTPKID